LPAPPTMKNHGGGGGGGPPPPPPPSLATAPATAPPLQLPHRKRLVDKWMAPERLARGPKSYDSSNCTPPPSDNAGEWLEIADVARVACGMFPDSTPDVGPCALLLVDPRRSAGTVSRAPLSEGWTRHASKQLLMQPSGVVLQADCGVVAALERVIAAECGQLAVMGWSMRWTGHFDAYGVSGVWGA